MTGSCRCNGGRNGRMRSVQRRFPMHGAERKPFGADDFDVADAEEGEDRAQVFLLEVVSLERHSRCVKPAARGGHDHTLTAGQPDWAVRRVAEGFAGNRDAVDPCLELAWDAKVIHRCADDKDVGAKELVEHVAATHSSGIPTAPSGAFAGRTVGRRLLSRCGIGLASRSRRITSRPGIAAFSAATNAAESGREAELAPVMLESM